MFEDQSVPRSNTLRRYEAMGTNPLLMSTLFAVFCILQISGIPCSDVNGFDGLLNDPRRDPREAGCHLCSQPYHSYYPPHHYYPPPAQQPSYCVQSVIVGGSGCCQDKNKPCVSAKNTPNLGPLTLRDPQLNFPPVAAFNPAGFSPRAFPPFNPQQLPGQFPALGPPPLFPALSGRRTNRLSKYREYIEDLLQLLRDEADILADSSLGLRRRRARSIGSTQESSFNATDSSLNHSFL